jgi:hypothetical protein
MSQSPSPNPYAAGPIQEILLANSPEVSIFQHNGVLVMHKNAVLPERCIKCNEPTSYRLKRKLTWHHPWIFALLLLNVIVYVIVANVLAKRATIHIPLTDRFRTRRLKCMGIAWFLVLLSVLSIVLGIYSSSDRSLEWLMAISFISCPILLLAGILVGIIGCRMVYPKKIDDHYIWLKGVCKDYLASLPPWPGV